MMTTAMLVTLIMSVGWLSLNWRAYQSDATAAGWGGNKQLAMAAVWLAIITSVTLVVRWLDLT